MSQEAKLPVIDLLNFPAESEKLLDACTTGVGCFRVINHGIPADLQAGMKAAVASLFNLPDDVKRQTAHSTPGRGYSPLDEANKVFEAFGVHDAASSADVHEFCSKLQASPNTREVVKNYASKLHELALNVASKLAESLGVSDYCFSDWPCQFRMNKYHFAQEAIGEAGLVTHTDSGFLTVLQEDDAIGGLELMESSGEFVAVDPVPGSLLVNLGDIAKAWSNGRLHNVKHRVVCKGAEGPRSTIAFFLLGPKEDDKVEAPAALVDSEHPRLYRAFTYEEYFKLILSSLLFKGEALSLVAVPQAP